MHSSKPILLPRPSYIVGYLFIARGLDIPSIKTVVNYDVARDIDTHTHRVGRTGRAGEKGTAYTLITASKDIDFCAHLVRNLEGANQRVPSDVIDLALKVCMFATSCGKALLQLYWKYRGYDFLCSVFSLM